MSDNQSSNTLFHFTKDSRKHPGLENIINILKTGFEPRFRKEDMNFLFSESPKREFLIRCIPMVCFCDIPLSRAKIHMENYSNYGIGLKKEWGIEKGISPVLYIPPIQSKIFHKLFFGRIIQSLKTDKELDKNHKEILFGIFNMIKPYKGKLRKNGKEIVFYNEREWRFIPTIPYNTLYKNCLNKKEKFNDVLKREPLDFQSSHIKYIIVSKQDEISRIWDEINKIEKYSLDEKKSLCTKLISAQAINEDF
ncbi:MAG: abortive infection system antitoxin AbiGi family protein [Candidatus Methanoperedens sp.]|nr:abortive infection system antitoxin AbiGi family protein [Candidatus Methanoperedens sp.]